MTREISPRDAVERWLERQETELSPDSVKSYRYRLKLFAEWCEREEIENLTELTAWELDEYQHERRKKAKPITLQNQLGTLKRFIKWAETVGLVEDGLSESVDRPSTTKQQDVDDTRLPGDRAEEILSFLEGSEYGSRRHALFALLWFTGARMSAIINLDHEDFHREEQFVQFRHRPSLDLVLKNGADGERAVALPDRAVDAIGTYLDGQRVQQFDEHGLRPLLTTSQGRVSRQSLRRWTYEITQPCIRVDCPHDKDPSTCEYLETGYWAGCPSSRSPHQIRTGSITWQLNRGVPKQVVGDRANVSVSVLEKHYDKEDPVAEMQERRRKHIDQLNFPGDQP